MKQRFQAVKGTRDILPPDSALWNHVEQTARRVLEAYNYQEIRLPYFEETELFSRSVGADTDIVSKEMYTFEDPKRGGFGDPEAMQVSLDFSNALQSPETFREFVRGIKAEFEAEGSPPTPSKRKALENLIQGVETLAKTHKNLPEPTDDDDLETLRKRFQILRPIHIELVSAYGALIEPQQIALRPEATASVCRAYIEHGLHTRPGNVKLYYVGPMFRRERPQKGRFRQFYQIGAEVLGASDHPAIDAEIIEMVLEFIRQCGLTGCSLYVNSIGCMDCRPQYVELLRKQLKKVKDKLGPDSQRRIDTNPLRVFDSKVEGEQPVIEKLPTIADHLCEACRANFQTVQDELKGRGIAYEINPRLVRGLDYYVRTTFEITAPGLGAQNAVCGGGRYDGLIELLGGPPTKATGWALGTDRLVLALEQAEAAKKKAGPDVFVVWLGASAYDSARSIARKLRQAGVTVELPHVELKMKKALGRAHQLSAGYALIIGEDELKQGKFTLREMTSGSQRSLTEDKLLKELTPRS